ncbi:HNH endonuclease signature motif containing protein [Synechococcus sp. PROS-9-1]|uniref:HNH endonuclease signature motif containing protein n=1 Tax=Synechococcus sp. PROS-9-1 TaxID=1968775 RepID=UPI00351C0256
MRDEVKVARKQYELARRNKKVVPAPVCSRCGMTLEEHQALGLANLQLHHVTALRDGGHPTDPSNLITLCKFCHDWWHKYCEPFGRDWSEFMRDEPIHQQFWEDWKRGRGKEILGR